MKNFYDASWKVFRNIFCLKQSWKKGDVGRCCSITVILFNNNKTGELVPIELKHQKEKRKKTYNTT